MFTVFSKLLLPLSFLKPEDRDSRFLENIGSVLQFCRTNVSKNSVMNMGIRLYNKAPNKIREVGKMRQFKRVFRSYLVQQVFYSVEEYMLS
jgi:hypothetical protein